MSMLIPQTPPMAGVPHTPPTNGGGAPQVAPQPAPQAAPQVQPVAAAPQPQAAPRPPTVPLAAPGQMPAIAPTAPSATPVKDGFVEKVKTTAKENKGMLTIVAAFLGGLALRNRSKPEFPGPPQE